jgi:hypothetical protein
MGKPPKKMRIVARFYECEDGEVKALGILSKYEFLKDYNVKNP